MEKIILATVGDIEITKDQMIGILRNIPKEHAQSVAGEEGRFRLLEEMIAGELLYLDAKTKSYEEDEDFIAILEEAKRGLLQRFAVNKMFEEIQIDEETAMAHYEANRSNYMEAERGSAKHILVDSEEKCQQIKKEIEDGKEFGDAAKEYSSCPSKERGGDLGEFEKGQMVKEFEDAVFGSPVGEVVGPVKTQFGYHLISVNAVIPAVIKSFDEVAASIRTELANEKQSEVYHAKVEELKTVYPIKINPEGLK